MLRCQGISSSKGTMIKAGSMMAKIDNRMGSEEKFSMWDKNNRSDSRLHLGVLMARLHSVRWTELIFIELLKQFCLAWEWYLQNYNYYIVIK